MRMLLLVCAVLLLLSAGFAADEADAAKANQVLGRGINLGNALEAPKEGEWGVKLEADYFQKIKDAGFTSVRIPIRWSAHAGKDPPYPIDGPFFERVDWAIEQALSRGLAAIINVHHFDEVFQDPAKQQPRLEAMWKQIAERYRDKPDRLYFEILNEPHDKLTPQLWQEMFPKLLAVIRESNPNRMVIVGPGQWNNLHQLEKLTLPEKDRRLIVTFHYYEPFKFTHQGASWVKGSDAWKGTAWKGTPEEQAALAKDFAKAAEWAKKNQRPLFLGEFGAFSAADTDSRAAWSRAVVREAEKHGFSWAYWEFCSGFGAYDSKGKAWREPLLKALVDRSSP